MGDDAIVRILTSKGWQPCDGPLLRADLYLIGKALSQLSSLESGPIAQAERQMSIRPAIGVQFLRLNAGWG